MALRLEKHTLCAQRKEAPCMQHAGGTSQLARMLTAQNNSFVQLTSVHPVWCLLYARCAFCAGRKACVLLQGQVYHPLQHSFLLKQNAHTDETSA